jgi:phenylacetate-CoA ligase
MNLQKIYDASPLWMQNAMATGYGFRTKRQRYGREYHKHLSFLDEFSSLSRTEQEAYQVWKLLRFLHHVKEKSSFYRELYAGIPVEDFTGLDDLKRLPVVTKDMLRENISRVVTVSTREAIIGHTGGTTGMSLEVKFTEENNQQRMAVLDHFKAGHGFINLKMRRATFSGKHIVPLGNFGHVFWRYNSAIRQMMYSSFHITEETCPHYIRSLNQFRPVAIDGFVSSISEIAEYMLRHGVRFDFKPAVVFPTSETVTPRHREMIEEAFVCKVRDQYSSSEGAPFVWECREGRLHYDLSTGVIENMEGSDEILVTSFATYGTPLVRYRIGDRMAFDSTGEICRCGHASPLVQSIEGRAVDYLYTTKGGKVNLGNVANIVKNASNSIIRAQFEQTDLTAIMARLVVDRKIFKEKHGNLLIEEMHHKFGDNMKVSIDIVENIPHAKSGKYALIINHMQGTTAVRGLEKPWS